MRKLMMLIAVSTGLGLGAAQAQTTAESQAKTADACANASSQAEMTGCAWTEYEAADAALNEAYFAARDRARKYGAPQAQALLAAQRAWLAYRDAECTSRGMQYEGGSMRPMVEGRCKTELTRRRSDDLLRQYERH